LILDSGTVALNIIVSVTSRPQPRRITACQQQCDAPQFQVEIEKLPEIASSAVFHHNMFDRFVLHDLDE
jgi:hypothetical protein